jgi:hypothetical protein
LRLVYRVLVLDLEPGVELVAKDFVQFPGHLPDVRQVHVRDKRQAKTRPEKDGCDAVFHGVMVSGFGQK